MFSLAIEYADKLTQGLLMTLQLTIIPVVLAACLALPLAILRRRRNIWVQAPIRLFVSFFRGTPLLAQLFLVYYGSGQFREALTNVGLWWFFSEPLYCALLAFTLNSTAYQIEMVRGGLQAVNVGEIEAGLACGMSQVTLYRRIILPNTYRIAFPALGNEVILMLKGGAIASVITLLDIMGQTRRVFSQTFDISIYFVAAILYLSITTIFVLVWRHIEGRLNWHLSESQQRTKPHRPHIKVAARL